MLEGAFGHSCFQQLNNKFETTEQSETQSEMTHSLTQFTNISVFRTITGKYNGMKPQKSL